MGAVSHGRRENKKPARQLTREGTPRAGWPRPPAPADTLETCRRNLSDVIERLLTVCAVNVPRRVWLPTLEAPGRFVETQYMAVADDLQAIVQRLNRDNARSAARVANEQRRAYSAACDLAVRMGAKDPSLRRVILFGSTVPGRRYRTDSDIDLAVDGGDRALLERLAADLPQPVEIIGIDELRPGIRNRVLTEGIVLYEKK